MKKKFLLISVLVLIGVLFFEFTYNNQSNEQFVVYQVNPKQEQVALYWKNEKNKNFGSLNNLKFWLDKNNKELLFAMNGGMYKRDHSPQGLFIQEGNVKSTIDTTKANGNFYLKPNGIFYITNDNKAFVCKTEDFISKNIQYATQSGPMLVIDGEIHKAFGKNSANLNIRNGVGVLPNNDILFVMSKKEINFYEFAEYFGSSH